MGEEHDQRAFLTQLVDIQYDRNDIEPQSAGNFRVRGDVIEVHPAYEENVVRIELFGDEIERIVVIDPLTGKADRHPLRAGDLPNTHYATGEEAHAAGDRRDREAELQERLAEEFRGGGQAAGGPTPAACGPSTTSRCCRRSGFCNGIENYSMHIDGRKYGEAPFTLLDYFPKDFLCA